MSFHLNVHAESVMQAHPAQPLCVPPTMTVREAMLEMKEKNTGCALVCEQKKLIGVFTQRDVLRLLATEADLGVTLAHVMASPPVTVHASDSVATAIQRMTAGGYRHLPVVDDNNQPVGLLKVRGIVHYLVEHFPNTVYSLPPQPGVVAQEREGA